MRKLFITLLVVLVVVGAYVVWARGADERAEADATPLFVPVILTPSVQLVRGQLLLYKATNVSDYPIQFRLMLFNDREDVPGTYKDFLDVKAGNTVSYVYEPPIGRLTLGTTTIDAPEAVRASFAPMPGDDPGMLRRIVASAQIMRIQTGENAATIVDPPILVPMTHCNFEPRGFVPYTGGRWYWNCAPQMFPVAKQWRRAGQTAAR